nr:hypothetical protein BCU22_05575 [Vibrio cyclitrophicus]
MTPDIAFNGESLSSSPGVERVHFLTLPVNDGGSDIGSIHFEIEAGAAHAVGYMQNSNLVNQSGHNSDEAGAAGQKAWDRMVAVPGFQEDYSQNGDFEGTDFTYYQMDQFLTDVSLLNQYQARAFAVREAVVSFPSANIPTTWSASLPITVTVQ